MKAATAFVCLTALTCALVFFLISPAPNLEEAETISVAVGESVDLPFTEGDTYSSSAPLVVSVSLSGRATGLTPGAARITRTGGKAAVYDVNVEGVPVTSIRSDILQMYLKVGDSRKIDITLNEGASDRRLRFSSTDESIAVSDDNGTVTACGKGNCRIVCSAMNGMSVQVTITVE